MLVELVAYVGGLASANAEYLNQVRSARIRLNVVENAKTIGAHSEHFGGAAEAQCPAAERVLGDQPKARSNAPPHRTAEQRPVLVTIIRQADGVSQRSER